MQVQVQQWNQQLTVCIPAAIAAQMQLQAGMHVDLEVVDGKLMLLPPQPNPHLDQLLAEITTDNLHASIDTEEAIGQEAW